jgi:hypothetical protein
MKSLLTHRAPYAWEYAREHTCNMWRLIALSTALATGWLHVQAQTPPASTVPLTLPTSIPVQADGAVPLPVLGALILSPTERRQLDAASQLVTNGQGGFLTPGSQSRTAASLEAPMFWINRRPPDNADAGGALRVLSGNFGTANSDTRNTISGVKPSQTAQSPGATLPPGAITINRATPRTGASNPSRAPVN